MSMIDIKIADGTTLSVNKEKWESLSPERQENVKTKRLEDNLKEENPITSFVMGGMKGITAGLDDQIKRLDPNRDIADIKATSRARRRVSPIATSLGEFGGTAAGFLLPFGWAAKLAGGGTKTLSAAGKAAGASQLAGRGSQAASAISKNPLVQYGRAGFQPGATLGQRATAGATAGAPYGAIYGYNEAADQPLADRVKSAATFAAMDAAGGGIGGAAAPYIVPTLKAPFQLLGKSPGVKLGARTVSDLLKKYGPQPDSETLLGRAKEGTTNLLDKVGHNASRGHLRKAIERIKDANPDDKRSVDDIMAQMGDEVETLGDDSFSPAILGARPSLNAPYWRELTGKAMFDMEGTDFARGMASRLGDEKKTLEDSFNRVVEGQTKSVTGPKGLDNINQLSGSGPFLRGTMQNEIIKSLGDLDTTHTLLKKDETDLAKSAVRKAGDLAKSVLGVAAPVTQVASSFAPGAVGKLVAGGTAGGLRAIDSLIPANRNPGNLPEDISPLVKKELDKETGSGFRDLSTPANDDLAAGLRKSLTDNQQLRDLQDVVDQGDIGAIRKTLLARIAGVPTKEWPSTPYFLDKQKSNLQETLANVNQLSRQEGVARQVDTGLHEGRLPQEIFGDIINKGNIQPLRQLGDNVGLPTDEIAPRAAISTLTPDNFSTQLGRTQTYDVPTKTNVDEIERVTGSGKVQKSLETALDEEIARLPDSPTKQALSETIPFLKE